MDLNDVARIRMLSQQITEKRHKIARALIGQMGAMQAQDYNMAKWAIGLRVPGATLETIEAAIDQGEIIRTHVLRPTWHFVSASDIHWMSALTAPQIKTRMKSRNKELELTESVFSKSNAMLEQALEGRHLTREEVMAEFKKAKISVGNNRGSHLLMHAELEGIICSGKSKGNKHTYALLCERVPGSNTFNKDECLAMLAQKYFSGHCPATLQDFIWWSGLSITNARHALEMVKLKFASETIDGQTYWLTDTFPQRPLRVKSGNLLPAFDEYIIGYKDRSASITLENHQRTVSSNGIFWPVIVIDGKVTGLWKRTLKKDKVVMATEFFHPPKNTEKRMIEKSAQAFGNFLNKEVAMAH